MEIIVMTKPDTEYDDDFCCCGCGCYAGGHIADTSESESIENKLESVGYAPNDGKYSRCIGSF